MPTHTATVALEAMLTFYGTILDVAMRAIKVHVNPDDPLAVQELT